MARAVAYSSAVRMMAVCCIRLFYRATIRHNLTGSKIQWLAHIEQRDDGPYILIWNGD